MSADVVSLKAVRLEPVPDVVEALADLAAMAASGHIRGFAIVATCEGHAAGTRFVLGDGSISDYVCAIERLKLRLLDYEG